MWDEYAVSVGVQEAYLVLVIKLKGERPLWTPTRTLIETTETCHGEEWKESVGRISLPQDCVQ
jgi:hypothetical protein